MKLKYLKPIPAVLAVIALVGVIVHEMHIDRATTVAIALPTMVATAVSLDTLLKANFHTHVERAEMPGKHSALRSSTPRTQPPRDDDDRRHINNKRLIYAGGDTNYIWPSV